MACSINWIYRYCNYSWAWFYWTKYILYLDLDTKISPSQIFSIYKKSIKVSNFDRIKVFCDPEYYRVTRKEEQRTAQYHNGRIIEAVGMVERDLNFLAIDRNNFRYSMHIINTDNQKDALVKIKLENKTSLAASDEDFYNVSLANFSQNNINFQYGVE